MNFDRMNFVREAVMNHIRSGKALNPEDVSWYSTIWELVRDTQNDSRSEIS
jgi:hypothetical protein